MGQTFPVAKAGIGPFQYSLTTPMLLDGRFLLGDIAS